MVLTFCVCGVVLCGVVCCGVFRPIELSSKKPDAVLNAHPLFINPAIVAPGYASSLIDPRKQARRDPRFDDLSGELKQSTFKTAYSFINDIKSNEMNEVKQLLKVVKTPQKKEKLKTLLSRMV